LFRDPALLLDQNAMHDRDLSGGTSEAQRRDAKPGRERLAQRYAVLWLPLFGDRELGQYMPRCCANSRVSSFEHGFLSTFLPEIFVEVVEDLAAARNPFRVVLGRDADPFDQRPDARDFGAAELTVLEIDVMDDLRDGAQRRVLQRATLQQHFESAFVALVGELGFEHVEAQLAFVGAISLAGYEFEVRFGIDETPYQPGAGDPIGVYVSSRDPGPVAKRPKRACPGINRRFLRHGLVLVQSSL